jgi:subtilisin family serine protease
MQRGFEAYADLIIYYFNKPQILDRYSNYPIDVMNQAFVVVHIPVDQFGERAIQTFGYQAIPNIYGLTSEEGLNVSEVYRVRSSPFLNLRGEGTLIGVIDTGIDYTNPVFFKENRRTKIAAIWDQTIQSAAGPPYNMPFGTEYNEAQINQALASDNPIELVPSIDEVGHGTMMAAVAAGNLDDEAGFEGVSPDAELVIVKLRQAKQFLRDFFLVPGNVICYQENHIMWGIEYCVQKARSLNKPIVICMGVGTSFGPHDSSNNISIMLDIVSDIPGNITVVPAGNEGNMRRHFYDEIDPSVGNTVVELNVSEEDKGFTMELWGDSPGIYSIDILSPSGEYISRIPPSLRVSRAISFIYEPTVIYIDYLLFETITGDQLIRLRCNNMTPGIWTFTVYSRSDLTTSFHIWLPMGDMISSDTYFLRPNLYTTITTPGNALLPIVATAYNPVSTGLYFYAGRGFTRTDKIKPTLAAPGVNYIAPDNNKQFLNYSGTSVATAHTAGIVAMIIEWGIVRGNAPRLNTIGIKNYLIAGAERNPNLVYPNRDWGYGILNIYNVFRSLQVDFSISI